MVERRKYLGPVVRLYSFTGNRHSTLVTLEIVFIVFTEIPRQRPVKRGRPCLADSYWPVRKPSLVRQCLECAQCLCPMRSISEKSRRHGYLQLFLHRLPMSKTWIYWSTSQTRDLVRKALASAKFGLHQREIYDQIHTMYPKLEQPLRPPASKAKIVGEPPNKEHPVRSRRSVAPRQ
jgi:hypothetical protein